MAVKTGKFSSDTALLKIKICETAMSRFQSSLTLPPCNQMNIPFKDKLLLLIISGFFHSALRFNPGIFAWILAIASLTFLFASPR